MNEDDFEYEHWFDNNHYDDPNLTLPNYFVTCFRQDQLSKYENAVDDFHDLHPDKVGSLQIDESGKWNREQLPALLCWDRSVLPEFWKIFRDPSYSP